MNESARILYDKKRLIILLLLPFLSCALFVLERMGGDIKQGVGYLAEETAHYRENAARFAEMTLDEIAQQDAENYMFDGRNPVTLMETKAHVEGYRAYLENVQEQAERMSSSSVFGRNKSGFTYRNIQKTAKDFRRLDSVTPEFGANRAVEKWVEFRPADVLFLLGIVIVVLAFFEDKRCGLLPLVRSTPRGRVSLAAERLGILLAVSLVLTLLICGGTLAASFALYGGLDTLPHAVQSIVGFKTCTLRVTIGEWIALYFGAKVLCGFLLGLIIWFILSFLSNMQLAWLVIAGVLGAEYAAWAFIPPQMAISFLKYVNVFAYVFPAETLSKYVNMNFFGLPVGTLTLLAALFVLLAVGLTAGALIMAKRRHPLGRRDLLGRVLLAVNRVLDVVRSRLPVFGVEWYKLLFPGAAALFIIAALWYSPRLHFVGYSYNSGEDFVYTQYLAEAAGPVNEDTYAYIAKARANIMPFESDVSRYEEALDKLESEADAVKAAAEEGGYAPWLCEQSLISDLFGSQSKSIHRWNAIVAVAFVIVLTAPIFTFERKSGTERLLRSAPRGRAFTFVRKMGVALLLAAAVWAIIYIRQWHKTLMVLGEGNLGAPVGNIPILRGLPVNMTLRGVIALVFLVRLAALLVTSLITAYISFRSQSWEKAVMAGVAVLVLPAVLYYFEREWAGFISIIPAVTGTELVARFAARTANIAVFAAWTALGVLLTVLACRESTRALKDGGSVKR
ncbi:MAG: hypothetical protein II756_05225 [Clostridia bacterium]|nr:hypothetical protein [Clostridia bacterium]